MAEESGDSGSICSLEMMLIWYCHTVEVEHSLPASLLGGFEWEYKKVL